MKKWLIGIAWTIDTRHFAERASEAMREIGVLWLVFATLDKLVADELTVAWTVANGTAAIAAWAGGIYIEILNDRRHA